jgi:hypothetical protein
MGPVSGFNTRIMALRKRSGQPGAIMDELVGRWPNGVSKSLEGHLLWQLNKMDDELTASEGLDLPF